MNTTLVGNVATLEPLHQVDGRAQLRLKIAVRRDWKTRGGQDRNQTSFVWVTAWSDLATNAAASLEVGQRIVVTGYLDDLGGRRGDGVAEIAATDIALSTMFATCRYQRVTKVGAR